MAQHSMTTWRGRGVPWGVGRPHSMLRRGSLGLGGLLLGACNDARFQSPAGPSSAATWCQQAARAPPAAYRHCHTWTGTPASHAPTWWAQATLFHPNGPTSSTPCPSLPRLPTSRAVSGSTFCPAKPLAAAHLSFTVATVGGEASAPLRTVSRRVCCATRAGRSLSASQTEPRCASCLAGQPPTSCGAAGAMPTVVQAQVEGDGGGQQRGEGALLQLVLQDGSVAPASAQQGGSKACGIML